MLFLAIFRAIFSAIFSTIIRDIFNLTSAIAKNSTFSKNYIPNYVLPKKDRSAKNLALFLAEALALSQFNILPFVAVYVS